MVEFVVRVPPDSPGWEPLFLAGGGAALGDWAAAGVELQRCADGTARARVAFPPASRVQYLVTRGRWRLAESDGAGRERAPRELVARADAAVEVEVAGWGRGSVRYSPDFGSRYLPHARPVSVFVPPGYDLEGHRRYPVLYLHDGQNLFDAATAFAGVPWAADEVAEREARRHAADAVIVVGVGNSPDRLREYGPRRGGPEAADDLSEAYGRFLVEELKPSIDAAYRTAAGPEATGVGGSSMGGLVSLHLCRRYPGVFGRCAALSPSLWWDREAFLRAAPAAGVWPRDCRLWLDTGDREGAGQVAGARRLARALAAAGRVGGIEYAYREVAGGTHDEAAWHARFDGVVRFLFPPRPSHAV